MLLARTSAPVAPMVIEELRMCPVGDADAIAEATSRDIIGKSFVKPGDEQALFERVGIVRQNTQDAEILNQLKKDADGKKKSE